MITNLDREGVSTWGSGRSGQLGHGNTESKTSPCSISMFQGMKIEKIYCYAAQSAVITNIGLLYHWGWYGEQPCLKPEPIIPFNGVIQVEKVSLGGFHILALGIHPDDNKRYIYSWGRNEHGQLGLPNITAIQTPTIIESISSHSMVNIFTGEECSGVVTGKNQIKHSFFYNTN